MDGPNQKTARRFEAWLRVSNKPRAAVAREIGVDPSLITHLAAGRARPGIDVAVAIERLTAAAPGGPILPRDWIAPSPARKH